MQRSPQGFLFVVFPMIHQERESSLEPRYSPEFLAVPVLAPSRAYSAEGRTPEHRSREAQRAACRSAAGRRSRPPLAAASAESEGPKSPIIRRERAAGFGGDRIVRTAPPLRCNTTSLSFDARRGEAAASELP